MWRKKLHSILLKCIHFKLTTCRNYCKCINTDLELFTTLRARFEINPRKLNFTMWSPSCETCPRGVKKNFNRCWLLLLRLRYIRQRPPHRTDWLNWTSALFLYTARASQQTHYHRWLLRSVALLCCCESDWMRARAVLS